MEKNISSEQELLELRKDGKITEEEFNQLLAAIRKSRPNNIQQEKKRSKKYLLWIIPVILALGIVLFIVIHVSKPHPVTQEKFRQNFPEKVAKLDIDTANLKDVKRIFGEPLKYVWGEHIIDRGQIPTDHYCVVYPDGVHILMRWDSVIELRFESPAADYAFRGGIRVGSSLEEVLEKIGEPVEIIEGGEIGWSNANRVLYKDVEGKKGYCYYHCPDQNIRFFFVNYKVKAMYITRSDYGDV